MKKILLSSLLISFALSQLAFMEPRNSKLETSQKVQNKTLTITFKINPNKGIKVTDEGPWGLTLTETDGLGLPLKEGKFKLKLKDYDSKIPGFKVTSSALTKASGQVKYRLKAFVCTEDKSRCFPEIHKGSFKWTGK